MKKIDAIVNKISDYVAYASMVAVCVMMILNVIDSITTKTVGNSVKGAYEISEVTLMCAIFLALAYGQTKKTHVHMTLFIGKLPGRTKYIPFFLGNCLSVVMMVLLSYAMIYQTGREFSSNSVTSILHIPYYPFYVISVIGIIAFLVTLVYDTIISLLGPMSRFRTN
ncbi:MAG: TRAP transporter small permease [Clostridiales bacterium]|nr:TRAP transporter small permease [Clostridiales bacterium]